jgi:hypothetical protein
MIFLNEKKNSVTFHQPEFMKFHENRFWQGEKEDEKEED